MYEGMIYSIGEDLSVELVVFLLVLLVIIYMELLEVFIFKNKIFILFVIKDIVLSIIDSYVKKVLRIKIGSVDNFILCCRILYVYGV